MLHNHSETPLVTAQLMCCAKDVRFLPRSIGSVVAQTLDPKQIQLQIVYDGDPDKDGSIRAIHAATRKLPFPTVLINGAYPVGYYCAPRNRALSTAWGFYLAHLDADNEWRPEHLAGLLAVIRTPQAEGWPHFVYARREYVADEGAKAPESVPLGPSRLTEWNEENCGKLLQGPFQNFVDTGDFLIGRSALYELAERTGFPWNHECRRFGDWDLMCRLATAGLRGHAVDQVSHVYHWTGENLQVTRKLSEIMALPMAEYLELKKQGLIVDGHYEA